ncbi:MAG: class I SAM-dependent methyltransferase [Nitrolancea sp.]
MNWDDPANWYNAMNPWGLSDDFYLKLVMDAASVLDVGCGTGSLLHHARDAGHTGRLTGLDPDQAMLRQAQVRDDIEWLLADAASAPWTGEFDLAVMTGHAFQTLISDDVVRHSFRSIHAALVDGGRFAFETRHPQARAWEDWHGSSFEASNPEGEAVTVSYDVLDVSGDVVRLTETLTGRWWESGRRTDFGELRFMAPEVLARFLDEAGFVIEEQFGDWQRHPIGPTSPEIITIARKR